MGISMNSRQKGSLDIENQRLNYIIFFEENHMEQKITEEDKRNACSLWRSDKTLRKSTQHKTEGVNQFSNSRTLSIWFCWKKIGGGENNSENKLTPHKWFGKPLMTFASITWTYLYFHDASIHGWRRLADDCHQGQCAIFSNITERASRSATDAPSTSTVHTLNLFSVGGESGKHHTALLRALGAFT